MIKIRLLLPLVLFIVLGVLFWQALSLNPSFLPSTLIGKPLPALEVKMLDQAKNVNMQSLTHEKYTLINVWASWCMSCYQEHEFLKTLAAQNSIQLIGLNYKDDTSKALIWLARFGDPYHINLADPDGKIGIELGVYNTPETFLINPQGVVLYRFVGILNEEVWKKEFLPLMG